MKSRKGRCPMRALALSFGLLAVMTAGAQTPQTASMQTPPAQPSSAPPAAPARGGPGLPELSCPELATALRGVAANDVRLRDWPQLNRYRNDNRTVTGPDAVFIGDSITDNWQQPR